MNNSIFIPKQINVGFQNRNDTYTGKLAYVIYFDNKGVLRKEASWKSWRDESIDNVIYDNVPISGFVLNKKAGGYDTGWNHRQTYTRVYDPRGFEFEITVENLLYILENCNSIKGKGLEGEFIYSFDGKDLLLLPVDSPDYKELSEFNELLFENKTIKAKELKIGATYKSNKNEELVYMGRFDEYNSSYYRNEYTNNGKKFFFYEKALCQYDEPRFVTMKSISKRIIDVIDENCIDNYTEIFEKLESKTIYSPYDFTKDEYIPYTLEEFKNMIRKDDYWTYYANKECNRIEIRIYDDGILKATDRRNLKEIITGTIEEVYNKTKPCYINMYLENGKLYERRDWK